MGHWIRVELWKQLCTRNGNMDSHLLVYNEMVDRLPSFDPHPSFLCFRGTVLSNHRLNDVGKKMVLQILAVVEMARPDFTKVPILHPLAAALLHYMKEDEVYACLLTMLEQNQKYLLQTDIAYTASKHTLLMLIKKHVSKAYSSLYKLVQGSDESKLVAVFEEWHGWIFRDLPFTHLVRVIDCFMYEGQKVLYRVAIAIIFLWRKHNYKALKTREGLTAEMVAEEISEFSKTIPVAPDKLLKTAFGIRNLKMSLIQVLLERYELEGRKNTPSLTPAEHRSVSVAPYLRNVRMETKILNQEQVGLLMSWLPERIQLLSPVRLFSVRQDGTSFMRLWQKIDDADWTLIVVETGNKEIIGAYCSCSWVERRTNKPHFFGTGESFLFRLCPDPRKYAWVGVKDSSMGEKHSENLFLMATATSLQVGGGAGEGFCVREELVRGVTTHCETFANEPLVQSGNFDIGDMEVFTFSAAVEE